MSSNLLRKLAGETAIYGSTTILGRFLNYLLVPLYTRLFTESEYGEVNIIFAYITFLMVIFTHGMETGFFSFINRKNREGSEVFSTAFLSVAGISLICSILLLSSLSGVAEYTGFQSEKYLIVWVVGILAFDALAAIPFAFIRHSARPLRFGTVKLLNISMNIGLNLFFLLFCPYALQAESMSFLHPFVNSVYNSQLGIGYIILSNLIASGLTLILLLPELKKMKFNFKPTLWKEMFTYASPLILIGVAGMINETFDRLMLERLLPYSRAENRAQIGIYSAVYKLSILMTLGVQAFRFAAEPFFFSQSEDEEAPRLYARVMDWFLFFGLLVFLGVTFYIDLLKYFIGESGSGFHEGLHVVPILLLANLFLGLFYNLSVWYKLTSRNHFGAVIAIGGALLTILMNFILIPKIGYMGSAWATFTCYFSMCLASYFWGRRFYKVPYNLRSLALSFGVAISLFFISKMLSSFIPSDKYWMEFSMNTLFILLFIAFFLARQNRNYVLNLFKFLKPKHDESQNNQ